MNEIVYEESDADGIAELLIGRTVKQVTANTLELDNGTVLRLVGNEGCGSSSCGNGTYELSVLNGCDNVITRVELINQAEQGVYEIFVYAGNEKINLARFDGDDGNEYYGSGYTIYVKAMNP